MPRGNERSELTSVAQDYLKVIWAAREWDEVKVTTSMIAERLEVSPSTASEGIRKLSEQGLLEHEKYGAITLTEAGRRAAVGMVRRHRLLETYLVSELGYTWDEVHDEAEILEHAVSDRLMERMDAKLGHPRRDPHGDPIPSPDGEITSPEVCLLADLADGESGTIARISDTDPAMLRYFDEVGIALDGRVRVTEKRPFAGTTTITVDDAEQAITLGDVAARAIFVAP
ncbi:metal-dependent transcriptional regulator [Gordonia sp. X0973]|uniref:metal-dependent transcriptional regulator n=1 Tax=Gordonia sp. X0973 TaxID=2742602 RepID=UPI000F51BC40|nr:metal-dependent transcriptional regulator [Gordonia sp. X0973]QKT07523.1 metal-dependent transcriptional regulator [Gordonia sp. X0973]